MYGLKHNTNNFWNIKKKIKKNSIKSHAVIKEP